MNKYPCVHNDNGICRVYSDEESLSYCVEGPCKRQELSRADKIRNMTDEELAAFMVTQADLYCRNLPECGESLDKLQTIPEENCIACALKWLKEV